MSSCGTLVLVLCDDCLARCSYLFTLHRRVYNGRQLNGRQQMPFLGRVFLREHPGCVMIAKVIGVVATHDAFLA